MSATPETPETPETPAEPQARSGAIDAETWEAGRNARLEKWLTAEPGAL